MSRSLLDEALALKELARAGWVQSGVAHPESVAAHSWGVAWLALVLCPPGLDLMRVLALAVIHDLAEVRMGDLTPRDPVSPEEKAQREAAAAAELLAERPDLLELWRDYARRGSAEARFVHQLDKLDLGLTARRLARGQVGWDPSEFIDSARAALSGPLRSLLEE